MVFQRRTRMPKNLPWVSTELRYFFRAFVACVCVLGVFRLVLLGLHFSSFQKIPFSEILLGFVYGMEVDATVAAYGVIVGLVLAHIPIANRWVGFRLVWISWMNLFLFFVLVLSVIDLVYFHFMGKRIGFEVFAYLLSPELTAVIRGLFASYFFVVVLACFGFALSFWGTFKLLRNQTVLRYDCWSYRSQLVALVLFLPLLVFLIRGFSFQGRPKSIGHSIFSRFHDVNVLSLNPTYLALRSLQVWEKPEIMEKSEATRIVSSLLGIRKEDILDPQYPLFRATHLKELKQYNIVVVLMESWGARHVGPLSQTPHVTPVFNRLAKEGLYFDRFFSVGYMSRYAWFSTLRGFPDQYNSYYLNPNVHFGSLCSLLKPYGYRCFGFTGMPASADSVDKLLLLDRFDGFVTSEDFGVAQKDPVTTRVLDHFLFDKAVKVIKENETRPFLVYIKTETSHLECSLPLSLQARHNRFSPQDGVTYQCLNAFHYSDWALGQFVEKLKDERLFDNTVFVISGDHANHVIEKMDMYDTNRVPMLVYGPKIVRPEVRSVVGTHADILPTIAGIVGLPYHASLGRDLRQVPDGKGFAFVKLTSHNVAWIDASHVALMDTDNFGLLVYDHRKRDFSKSIGVDDPQLAEQMKKRLSALWQFGRNVRFSNAIIPKEFLEVGDLAVGGKKSRGL